MRLFNLILELFAQIEIMLHMICEIVECWLVIPLWG